jgi:isopropylmalate/homocitrate/citramalate synthase
VPVTHLNYYSYLKDKLQAYPYIVLLRIKNVYGKNACSIHIYIRGSYFLIKQKMNKSKKNYFKISMPLAKYMAEYATKCCLEGILSARYFIKGFYRYDYVFRCLKQFFFSEYYNIFKILSRNSCTKKI